MRIDLALLGDYAIADKMDKLTVAGIFRDIYAVSVPFARPVMYLALTVAVEPLDGPKHHLSVRMIDPDGKDVIPELHADMEVARPDPETDATMNLVLELNGVQFATTGTHCFDIFLDGRFTERVPLEVGLLKVEEPN
ncbi:MAG: DUF6941 family protein [Thermoleophilia bacterium]